MALEIDRENYETQYYDEVLQGLEQIKSLEDVEIKDTGWVHFESYCITLPNGKNVQLWIHNDEDGKYAPLGKIMYWEPAGGVTVPQLFYQWEEGCCGPIDHLIDTMVEKLRASYWPDSNHDTFHFGLDNPNARINVDKKQKQ